MTKLEQLIKELCPNGVEHKRFDEVCSLHARIGWQRLTKAEYKDTGEYMLITGTDFTTAHKINYESCVYVTEDRYLQDKHIQLVNGDILITKDGTLGKVAQVTDLPMKATLNGGVFVVRCIDGSLDNRFILHYLLSHHFKKVVEQQKTGSTISHLTQALFSRLQIPVPPIEVQAEIVKVLDNFTELTAELTAELKAELTSRKKQYEYYRDLLLGFGVHEGTTSDYEWRTLGEICKFYNGDRGKNYPSHSDYREKGIPFINAGDLETGIVNMQTCNYISEEKYNSMGGAKLRNGDIIYCLRGSIGKNGIFQGEQGTLASSLVAIRANDTVCGRYIYYLLNSSMELRQRIVKDNGAAQPNLSAQSVKNYLFPIPPIEEQERIVSILDRFDKLCNDISEGLPAEIEARRKQYEYYRDKLLSFE